MVKFNLKMAKTDGYKNYNKMIEDRTKFMDLESEEKSQNINLKLPVKDKDNTKLTETQLDENRQGKDTLVVAEKALNTSKKLYNNKRQNEWDTDVMPINLETEKYHQEKTKAYKAAEDAQKKTPLWNKKDTAFWDKYINVQMIGKPTKIDKNVSNSQLQNQEDRYTGLTDATNAKFDKMVLASLKDADAMLFHIYATASSENRKLNDKEKQMVIDIDSGKHRILAKDFKSTIDTKVS